MPGQITRTPVRQRPEQIKRVAVYCRVSSRIDVQIRSVGAQAKYLIDIAVRHKGWSYEGVYIDICSGAKAENRTELQRMLDHGRLHLIDIILVRTVSRLGRNTLDTLQIAREMMDNGIEIIFVDENISTATTDGELMLTLMACFAQTDNQSRRMNIKWGMQKKVNDGTSVLFKKKCYGFSVDDKGELVINEPEARVVRWIFQSYLSGNSLLAMQRQLLEAGVQSPSGKKKWGFKSIDGILRNEKYYGAVCINKTYMSDAVVPKRIINDGDRELIWWVDHHEPIVSKQMFADAMEERERRSNYEVDENGVRKRRSKRFTSTGIRIVL